jgi:ATP-dependent Clp protease ATP-binding subunit ClpA
MQLKRLVNDIIIKAYDEATANFHEYITPEHILYEALGFKEFSEAIENCEGNIDELKNNLKSYIDEYIDKIEGIEPQQSFSLQQVIIRAANQAMASGKSYIHLSHIIAAIYDLEESYAAYFLQEQGIDKSTLIYNLCHENHEELVDSYEDGYDEYQEDEDTEEFILEEIEENPHGKKPKDKSILEKYTSNLTKLVKEKDNEPLIGREDILQRTIQILCRRTKNNPVHVGEPGVGKTAITMGLAKLICEDKIPNKLKGAEIFSLDIGSMLAGTKYRGDFEERIKKVLNEIKNHENPIVYIDEIHNIVGAGSLGTGSLDASNLLKPYLLEGKIKFIGATTFEEYKKYFEKDKALSRRFQTITVKEPTIEETIEILLGLKEHYENFHKVKYTEDAIVSAVKLSHKYINDTFLPDKAIDIIDEAGSLAVMQEGNEEFRVIDEKAIEKTISKVCSIPEQRVEGDEIETLKNMESSLKKSIFGQDAAIEEVVRCIKMSRAGLNAENKPVASMLFVGPTGVGKTEIARTLAKELGIELVRFDMSEYMEKHAASKLIGSPPGYVGYEEGGLLTDTIRKKPNCVLLLDEVEKAHNDILNVLLQVMDYATLTDNQGRKADFRNVIIIMTSNAGARNIGRNAIGFGDREIKGEVIKEEVNKVFTPEFRNRLDRIVVFNHIDNSMALNIARKELENFKETLSKKNVHMTFSEDAALYVAKKGISKEFGAREIIRVINSELKPLLVDEILFGSLNNGGQCSIDVLKDKFIILKD